MLRCSKDALSVRLAAPDADREAEGADVNQSFARGSTKTEKRSRKAGPTREKARATWRKCMGLLLAAAIAPTLCAMTLSCDQAPKGGGHVPVTGVRLYYKPFEETRREAIEAGLYQNLNIEAPRLITLSGEDIGREISLTVDVQPEDATNKELVWRSSRPSIVTVENGVVTAMGFGEATITVTTVDGGLTDTFRITILTPENETIF
jgi:hypothetical protein